VKREDIVTAPVFLKMRGGPGGMMPQRAKLTAPSFEALARNRFLFASVRDIWPEGQYPGEPF
jgi:hypothetical protein